MKSCTSLLVGVIIGIITFYLSPGVVRANEIFYDDFSVIDPNHWNIDIATNSGGVVNIIDNSYLHISSQVGRSFPYVSLKNISFPINNYVISLRFKFSGFIGFGCGIFFSDRLLPYGMTNEFSNSDSIFHIWPTPDSKIWINSWVCNQNSTYCDGPIFSQIASTDLNTWNTIDVFYDINNVYSLYLNRNLIFVSGPSLSKISNIWFGSPQFITYPELRPDVNVDYIRISTTANLSLFPTIIIPGLGASWDMGAIMSGTDGTNWQVPSFVKSYDGLKNSFINAGYSETADPKLFVFSYDWRRSLNTLADRLNTYITDKVPTGKVNLVGHSMGGLVARAYAQKYGSDLINNIVTVGSPNMGTTKAYGVWEGATVWDDVWWGKLALELTNHFGSLPGESGVDTVQRLAPSFKDLLPTYDFLKRDSVLQLWSGLGQINDYLFDLNENIASVNSLTTAIYSNEIQTDSIIKVVAPSGEDTALDLWIDGKPININPFETVQGDGTVTETSAKGPLTDSIQGTGWHGELVTKVDNIKKIFNVLGLDQTKVIAGIDDSRKNVLVVALRSPGILQVCNLTKTMCNSDLGVYDSENKLFMLPGYNNEDLVVIITESGEKGLYKLHLGDIDNTSHWNVIEGNLIRNGQVDFYDVQSNSQGVSAKLSDDISPTVPTSGLPNGNFLPTNEFDFTWGASTDDKGGKVSYEFQSTMNPFQSNGILTNDLWKSGTLSTNMIHSSEAYDGTWYWQVRAKDESGNYSNWSQIWTITIDRVSPTIPMMLGFKNPTLSCGTISNVKYLTVDWLDSTDNIGLAGYEYYVDYPLPNGVGRDVWNPTTLWSISENFGSLNEGGHYIKVKAVDLAGNKSDWSNVCEITYDSVKPILISKSVLFGWYKTPQNSLFNYSDPNLRNDYADPSCIISTEGSGQSCTITPNVCDLAGNCNTDLQTSDGVNIDMTPPTSTFVLPAFSSNWDGKIFGTASDNLSGIAKVELIITNLMNVENTIEVEGTTNWTYTLPKIIEGEYIIQSYATDVAGNVEMGLVSQQITFDHTAPLITIFTPTPVIYQSWNVPMFSYRVVDNIDNDPDFTVDGWSNSEGIQTMMVTATDSAGNVATKSVTYTIKNPPIQKDQCMNNYWKTYDFMKFKNQGECVSFVELFGKIYNKFSPFFSTLSRQYPNTWNWFH